VTQSGSMLNVSAKGFDHRSPIEPPMRDRRLAALGRTICKVPLNPRIANEARGLPRGVGSHNAKHPWGPMGPICNCRRGVRNSPACGLLRPGRGKIQLDRARCATGIRSEVIKVEQSKEVSGRTDSIRSTTFQMQRAFWCGGDAFDFSRHRALGHSKGLADGGGSSACFRCARSS
jgi:hypothetical protein